ncbi:uncharacterized protein [Musca autumnalis]|uniref:uncharacterized protein n=1 Tax=Musca autumnalis TaxID=221902 RepID=UPI003CED5007
MNSAWTLYHLSLLLILWLETGQAVRNFDIMFNYSNCTIINEDYVGAFGCPLHAEPRNRGNYLSGFVSFKRDINKILLDFRVQMPSMNNSTSVATDLLKFRIDGCHLSGYKAPNPIVESIVRKLKSGGNFAGCPLKANFNFTVRYFALNPDYFPPITPEMTFSATMNFFTEKTHLLSAKVEARVVKKKALGQNVVKEILLIVVGATCGGDKHAMDDALMLG